MHAVLVQQLRITIWFFWYSCVLINAITDLSWLKYLTIDTFCHSLFFFLRLVLPREFCTETAALDDLKKERKKERKKKKKKKNKKKQRKKTRILNQKSTKNFPFVFTALSCSKHIKYRLWVQVKKFERFDAMK